MTERKENKDFKPLYVKGGRVVWSDGKDTTIPTGFVINDVRISSDGKIEYVIERTYFDSSVGQNPITEKRLCKESELKPDIDYGTK
jgi:hypothetical protein